MNDGKHGGGPGSGPVGGPGQARTGAGEVPDAAVRTRPGIGPIAGLPGGPPPSDPAASHAYPPGGPAGSASHAVQSPGGPGGDRFAGSDPLGALAGPGALAGDSFADSDPLGALAGDSFADSDPLGALAGPGGPGGGSFAGGESLDDVLGDIGDLAGPAPGAGVVEGAALGVVSTSYTDFADRGLDAPAPGLRPPGGPDLGDLGGLGGPGAAVRGVRSDRGRGMPGPRRPPYRAGLAAGLGPVLFAAAALAGVDALHTGGGTGHLPALLALWALLALPLGLFAGLVLGAGNATWGPGWVRGLARRLRRDAALDRAAAAVLVSAVALAGVLALGVAKLSVGLVGDVSRKSVGGLLLGVVVVAVLPVVALGALPLFRVARRLTAVMPALGPLSRVVVLLIAGAGAMVGAGAFIIYQKLDREALALAPLVVPALLPVGAIALALLMYGPLDRVRRAIPARGALAAAGALIAAVLAPIAFRQPSDETRDAITERSYIGPQLIAQLRRMFDGDGDGYSAFFGGPDCDDHNKDVNPGAREIPADGIDNNCVGGDARPPRPAVAAAPAAPAAGDPAVAAPAAGDPAAAAPAAAPDAPAAPAISGGKSVLVIFIDTLRFDRLGVSGYRRDGASPTPRIDALAGQSVVFRRAFAQAPNTPRSVPSLLASRYPSQLAVENQQLDYMVLRDEGNDFLFEALRPAGLRTIGESSHFYFCDRKRDPAMCEDVVTWMKSNVLQGADEWNNDEAQNIPESNYDTASPRIVKKTVARLDALARDGARFAMLVHLFDPHGEYVAREGFPPVTEKSASGQLSRKYDYEVSVVDRHVGELLDALDRTGLARTTTVVLLSDHGEAFGVHRFAGKEMFYHGQTLYKELLHVPLMLRVPGVAPRVADDVVELLDVAPTLAELFGAARPASWQGRSLVPALAGQPLPPRPAFAELLPCNGWKHAARSLISADGARHLFFVFPRRYELYDLEADPDERQDVAKTDPQMPELKAQLLRWMESDR